MAKFAASSLRLVSFQLKSSVGIPRIGIKLDREIADYTSLSGIHDIKQLIATDNYHEQVKRFLDTKKFHRKFDTVEILAPIQNPRKIFAVGLNYIDHAKETNMEIPSEPILFTKLPSSIIGQAKSIVKPLDVTELDYEVELVVVIGREGKRIKKEDAYKYVAGYTIGIPFIVKEAHSLGNDISARDWQLKKPGGQWMFGKSFDTFCPLGPEIVTGLRSPHDLEIKCSVNGEQVQKSNTKNMIFKVDELIEYISKRVTLAPGDLIFTGTPPGVGMGRNPPLFLKHEDVVTCSIEGLGVLENKVVNEK